MTCSFRILYFERVSSTQDVAKKNLKENLVVVAEEMYAGRGRRGHKWHAPRGGLWMSAVVKPPEKMHLLTLAAGVAVVKALSELNISAGLKYPNDIFVNGKKAGGILTELYGELAVVGIGINLQNQIPDELRDIAISLPDIKRDALLGSILKNLCRETKKSPAEIIREWKQHSINLGRWVRVSEVREVYEGIAMDLDEDGFLLVKTDAGIKRVVAGDVALINPEKDYIL